MAIEIQGATIINQGLRENVSGKFFISIKNTVPLPAPAISVAVLFLILGEGAEGGFAKLMLLYYLPNNTFIA